MSHTYFPFLKISFFGEAFEESNVEVFEKFNIFKSSNIPEGCVVALLFLLHVI